MYWEQTVPASYLSFLWVKHLKKKEKYFKEENAKNQQLISLIVPGLIYIFIFYTLLRAVIKWYP